jgi:hypothetical protein
VNGADFFNQTLIPNRPPKFRLFTNNVLYYTIVQLQFIIIQLSTGKTIQIHSTTLFPFKAARGQVDCVNIYIT